MISTEMIHIKIISTEMITTEMIKLKIRNYYLLIPKWIVPK